MEHFYSIKVKAEDIDQLGHVNNVVYLKWVQEAAISHWDAVATTEMKVDYIWVVIRHEIDYLNACFFDTPLVAKTWVGETEAAKSIRHVEILNKDTNKLMVKVKTTWLMLEAQSKRPKRVTNEIIDLFK